MKKKKSTTTGLQEFIESNVEEMLADNRISTARSYVSTLSSVMLFSGRNPAIGEIDADFVMNYAAWMKKKGLTDNTISFYMRVLRAVLNKYGVDNTSAIFRNVYTGVAKTIKRAISLNDIRTIKNASGLPSDLEMARDMFMFSFYMRGMAFVDVVKLTRSNISGDYISYKRSKTGQRLFVKIENDTKRIIEKYRSEKNEYIFPVVPYYESYDTAIRVQNARLFRLSRKLGFETSLTTYVARHTWASLAKKNGISISVISESLGHNDEKTTMIYLASFDQDVIDAANSKILGLLK